MNPSAFKDFVVCKALDVISGNGAYRKYLHQSCENGEVASGARLRCGARA